MLRDSLPPEGQRRHTHTGAGGRAFFVSLTPPRSKREKPSVSPSDLPDRLAALGTSRSRALLRQAFGDLTAAGDVLERLADAIRSLDAAAEEETV